MSTPVGDLFRQASTLDERDRATLAGLLLESPEHEVDEDVETAWQEDIERRLAELDADSVKLVPWEEVKAKLRQAAGAQHTHKISYCSGCRGLSRCMGVRRAESCIGTSLCHGGERLREFRD